MSDVLEMADRKVFQNENHYDGQGYTIQGALNRASKKLHDAYREYLKECASAE